MALTLGWYFHLPSCAGAAEVEAVFDGSLRLLLDAHRDTGAPLALAVTGGLLALLERSHPAALTRLRSALADGGVELLATSFHEVCPFLIPPRYLHRQIELDLQLKQRLFGRRPGIFWPGNLAWSPVLADILPALDLRGSVIGEAHLRESQQTQLWQWLSAATPQMASVTVDTLMGQPLDGRRFELDTASGRRLQLLLLSSSMRQMLSFGTSGAIHKPWDNSALDALIRHIGRQPASPHGFSGDDGDRINPVSIDAYRRLLHAIGAALLPASAAFDGGEAEALEFLPAHAPGGIGFWQDAVATAWQRTLDELLQAVAAGTLAADELLPLQDVFPLFWKRSARARWFYDRAWALLQRGHAASPKAPRHGAHAHD